MNRVAGAIPRFIMRRGMVTRIFCVCSSNAARTPNDSTTGVQPRYFMQRRGDTQKPFACCSRGGANPNNQIEGHNAPLHAASTHTEIALLLLNAGANIGAVGADNMTLFAYALLEGDAEAARFWAERNAPAHVPMQRKTRGILIFRVRENVEKMAIVRVHALEIAAEMDRAKSLSIYSLRRVAASLCCRYKPPDAVVP